MRIYSHWSRLISLVAIAPFFIARLTLSGPLEPHAALSINSQSEAILYRGWPALFTLEVLRNDAFDHSTDATPLLLVPSPDGWDQTLQLQVVRSEGGATLAWPTRLIGDNQQSITLRRGDVAQFSWWIDPGETAKLPAGDYEVIAGLDFSRSSKGWLGVTNSPPAQVLVADEPVPLSAGLAAEKKLRLAYYSFWTGKTNDAAQFVDDVLQAQPTNLLALSFYADLAELAGNDAEALRARDDALTQFSLENPDTEEAPVSLIKKHRSSLLKLLAPLTITARWSGKDLLLEWAATPNAPYRVEASKDLKSWSPYQQDLSSSDSSLQITVTPSGQHSFFRVVR